MKIFKYALLAIPFLYFSCNDDDDTPEPINEEEVITTMTVTLSASDGSATVVLQTQDLDGDGPNEPVVTVSGSLSSATSYSGSIEWLNEMEDFKDNMNYNKTRLIRQQKWYQMENEYFCPKWEKRYDRWKSHVYTKPLLDLQNKIQTLIKKGIDEGAKLISGGPGKPNGFDNGYYVKPTVFADVNNNMEIAKTEIFGPVLSVIPFETEEEAISIANDTEYGLTNYIQTQDTEKVQRVARKLRSGMVDVNGAGIAVDAPFGGFKHSGIGREAGAHGLEEFLEVKAVGGWS